MRSLVVSSRGREGGPLQTERGIAGNLNRKADTAPTMSVFSSSNNNNNNHQNTTTKKKQTTQKREKKHPETSHLPKLQTDGCQLSSSQGNVSPELLASHVTPRAIMQLWSAMFQKFWGDFKVSLISWCFFQIHVTWCFQSHEFKPIWFYAAQQLLQLGLATDIPFVEDHDSIHPKPAVSHKVGPSRKRWTLQPTNRCGIKSKRLKVLVLWNPVYFGTPNRCVFEYEETINHLSPLLVKSSLAVSQPGRIIRIDIEGVCLWIVRQDKTSQLQTLEDKNISKKKTYTPET